MRGVKTRVSHAATVRVHTRKYLCALRWGDKLSSLGRLRPDMVGAGKEAKRGGSLYQLYVKTGTALPITPSLFSSSSFMSSSAVSQAPPSQSPDSQRPPSTSSTLYLYVSLSFVFLYLLTLSSVTFLATLFLLLFVSCAIVLRSYILRRRYQRRLDEAMAAGMLLAPRTQGSKRKRFGAKPRLYDTWLAPTDGGGVTWSQLMVCPCLLFLIILA